MPLARNYQYQKKIVTIGGGTGHFTCLRGFVKLNQPDLITAVAGNWDSGRSSGALRVEEGILPPGDYMQCLLALMEDDNQLQEAILILRDRTGGHPLVNLLGAKSEKAHHGVDEGINGLRKLFRIQANIIPVSLVDVDLNAETRQGTYLIHEDRIDEMQNDPAFSAGDELARIYLDVAADANPRALSVIKQADKIIIPPGSPYTSIFPHLLVKGIPQAIQHAKGKLVAILNLMTTAGEDRHLTSASRWLEVFQYYLGDKEWIKINGKSRIDYLIVNENHIDKEVLEIYQSQGQNLVEIDKKRCEELAPGLQIISSNLVKYDKYSHLLRHDPEELAQLILSLP
ncbi:YvcK family protein [Candidatus Parcubacteria bacterium]|nr:MAG: YvcK family protein [Candidatus Parcubacteria bacterium]